MDWIDEIKAVEKDLEHSSRRAWAVRCGDLECKLDSVEWFYSLEHAKSYASSMADNFNYVLLEAWICLDYDATAEAWRDVLPIQDVEPDEIKGANCL